MKLSSENNWKPTLGRTWTSDKTIDNSPGRRSCQLPEITQIYTINFAGCRPHAWHSDEK